MKNLTKQDETKLYNIHLVEIGFKIDYPFVDEKDAAFESKLQRTISVDIRYILKMIDKWGQRPNISEELIFNE